MMPYAHLVTTTTTTTTSGNLKADLVTTTTTTTTTTTSNLKADLGMEPYNSTLRPLYRPSTPWERTVFFTQSPIPV